MFGIKEALFESERLTAENQRLANECARLLSDNGKLCAENESMLKETAWLREEKDRLRAENAALLDRVAALEEADRHARQLCNLLSYTGRPQKDNLGGADDGGN